MHLLFQTFFLFSVTEKKFTYRVGKETFKTTFSDRKVRFGTTVSISKNGRLASCSNLEWTSEMFDYNQKIPKAKNTTLWTIPRYQLGKCYTKDISKNSKFSFLLENGGVMKIFNPQFQNKTGKNTLKIYCIFSNKR